MRIRFSTKFTPLSFVVASLLIVALFGMSGAASAQQAAPFPPQLETVVPYQPTAFASDGKQRLVYEVELRNFESRPLTLHSLDVLDADAPKAKTLASFDATQLPTRINAIGVRPTDSNAVLTLQPGGSVIAYLMLTVDAGAKLPSQIQHRWYTSAGEVTTLAISTHQDAMLVLGPPLTGSGWLAETGLSNDNGHRRGHVVLHGRPMTSRRYAFDWMKQVSGQIFQGDNKTNAAYFSWGQPVIAVADAKVSAVVDGIPLNQPGSNPAVPLTLATIAGNNVQLDLGGGYYAYYMHLQPGSLRVKAGDQVKRGQVLGLVGNTGSSFAPHLHFEVTNSPVVLDGQGVPYQFESFEVLDTGRGNSVQHRQEMPMEKMVVDFGE